METSRASRATIHKPSARGRPSRTLQNRTGRGRRRASANLASRSGTTANDAVVALRVLKDLVNAGSPQKTITLQLDWTALESRFLLEVDPATLPAERYKIMSFRVGQSTEPKN